MTTINVVIFNKMKIEKEIRFKDIDKNKIIERLQSVGAQLVHAEFTMKRSIFDIVDDTSAWVRLREEFGCVTLSVKKIVDENSIDGTLEHQINVSHFGETEELLKLAGLKKRSYQENRRQKWMLGDVEVYIDEWPNLNPILEIEGSGKDEMASCVSKLGLNIDESTTKSITTIYLEDLGLDIKRIDTLTF